MRTQHSHGPTRRGLHAGHDCSWDNDDGFTPDAKYSPRNGPVYILPTVFHIVYDSTPGTDASEWRLSASTVRQAVASVNAHMRNRVVNVYQSVDRARAVDTRIELQLATTTPTGQASDGIIYYDRPEWTTEEIGQAVIDADDTDGRCVAFLCEAWDTNRYLNVYTFNVPG